MKSRDRHFLLKPALSLTFTPVYLKEDQSHHRNPQPPEDGLLASTSAWLDQRHHHHVKAWLEDSINTASCDFIWGSRFAQSTSSETEKKLKWWNSQRAVTVSHFKLQQSEMRVIGWRTSTLVPAGSCRAKFNIPKFFRVFFSLVTGLTCLWRFWLKPLPLLHHLDPGSVSYSCVIFSEIKWTSSWTCVWFLLLEKIKKHNKIWSKILKMYIIKYKSIQNKVNNVWNYIID